MAERRFRLFVSSPSDVKPERDRVTGVVDRLNTELEGVAQIEVLRWEDAFYTAAHSFQEAIEAAVGGLSSTDLVVCIIWKRAGLKLDPSVWRRVDGSPYESGTVLEFETAVAASRTHSGVPDVYLFRKTAPVFYQAERADEEITQHQLLEQIWKRWTETPEGYNTAGHQPFDDPDDFERKLDACIRQWLERRGVILKGPVWDRRIKGSPFRGLAPFEASHAPVFFGREAAIAKTIERLRRGVAFLLLIGGSGSGKSSLLRAGLLPRVVRHGVVPDIDLWRTALLLPTGDPLQNLATALFTYEALGGELAKGDFHTPEQLVGALRAGGDTAIAPIRGALERTARERAQKMNYDRPRPARLLLALDQVERLFVETSPASVEDFAAVLRALVEAKLAVVVAALRSDTYGRFQQVESFLALREAGATLDLLPPAAHELEDIITRPVAACEPPLAFENNEKGVSLAQVLAADAKGGDALPLLQMTLQLLYEAQEKRGDGVLRFEDYPGIDEAVARAAGEAIAQLDQTAPEARAALPALVTALVRNFEVDPAGKITLTLLPIARDAFERGRPARRALVDAFIAARLLTVEEADGVVRVRPVHEALLRVWPEALRILKENAALIRVRHTLEPMVKDWVTAPPAGKADHLVTAPALLAGAAQLTERLGDDLPANMPEFIAASLAADTRRRDAERRRQRNILVATAAGLVVAVVLAGLAGWQWRKAVQAEQVALEAERTAIEQKTLAEQQRGRAERTLAVATGTANALVFDLAREFRDRTGIPVALVRKILDSARELQRQLAESGEVSPELRRTEAVALMDLVETLQALGDVPAALASANRASNIIQELLEQDPNNMGYQRDLSISMEGIGDVLMASGRREEALEEYRKSLAITEKIAASAPNNPTWQRDLSIAYNKIGDVLVAARQTEEALVEFRKALAIRERLIIDDPNNEQVLRDLSISYNKIGEMLTRNGKHYEALVEYRTGLAIRERLVAANPGNAQRQRDMSVSHERIGDALVAAGDRAEALLEYRKSLAITEKLHAADPGHTEWQRDLSVSYSRLGDMLTHEGKHAEALEVYRKDTAIAEKLAATDPHNADWQSDLAISLVKLAEVGDNPRARLTRARQILRQLDTEGKLAANQRGWLTIVDRRISELK